MARVTNRPDRRPATAIRVSPLMLSDRMLGLAQDADRAGMVGTAQALLSLACAILDDPPAPMAIRHAHP